MSSDTDTGHREIQELLPWWTNGTLAPEDVRRVEAHLEHCADCRREAALLTELEETLEETRAPVLAEAPAARAEPARTSRRASVRPPGRSVLPWLGWAAAAVLAVLLGVDAELERGGGNPDLQEARSSRFTGVVPTYRLDAVRRSSADTAVLPDASSGGHFQLLLHVDLGAGALPLEAVLQDAEDRTVLRESGIESLYEGRFLFIHCTPGQVPPGRYVVVLTAMGPDAPEEPLRYSFRVAEPEDGEPP